MTAAARDESIRQRTGVTASTLGTTCETVETRRSLLQRSVLGLAGVGLTALVTGCGWGDDEDDDDGAEPGAPENSGLEEGAEQEGEEPGAEEESGVEGESGTEGNED